MQCKIIFNLFFGCLVACIVFVSIVKIIDIEKSHGMRELINQKIDAIISQQYRDDEHGSMELLIFLKTIESTGDINAAVAVSCEPFVISIYIDHIEES